MDLDRIVPERSASPNLPLLAFHCLERLIQKQDHLWSLLGKVGDHFVPRR